MIRSIRVLFSSLAILLTCAALPSMAHAQWSPGGVQIDAPFSYGFYGFKGWRDPVYGLQMTWTRAAGVGDADQRITEQGLFPTGWSGSFARTVYANSDVTTAADGLGGFLHTSSGYYTGPNQVTLHRSPADGSHSELVVATANAWDGDAAPDDQGGAFVSWIKTTSPHPLMVTRLTSTGTVAAGWPAAGVTVTSSTLASSITTDHAGGFIALWFAQDVTVRAQRFTAAGVAATGWPAGGLAIAAIEADVDVPQLIPSGPDAWITVHRRSDPEPGPALVTMHRLKGDGTTDAIWPASGLVVLNAPDFVSRVTAVSDGQNGAWLAYVESGVLKARHVSSDGTFAPGFESAGKPLLDPGAQYAAFLDPGYAIAPGSSGGLLCAWLDLRPTAPAIRIGWRLADGSPDPAEPDTGRVVIPHVSGAPGGVGGVAVKGLVEDGQGGGYLAWTINLGNVYEIHLNPIVHTALLDAPPRAEQASPSRLALSPNPASRAFSVRFALDNAEPARLELLDLAGRRVAVRDVGGVGEHVERFDDLGALPPGVYLVRLAHGNRVNFSRVALVH